MAGLAYLKVTVSKAFARVLSLVNVASSACSVSLPMTSLVALYSSAAIAKLSFHDDLSPKVFRSWL